VSPLGGWTKASSVMTSPSGLVKLVAALPIALLLLALLAVSILILSTGLVGTVWLTLLNGKASQRLQELIRTVASAVAVARAARTTEPIGDSPSPVATRATNGSHSSAPTRVRSAAGRQGGPADHSSTAAAPAQRRMCATPTGPSST
jgi:hypothetical protein